MIHNIVVKLLKHSKNTWLSQEDRRLMQDAAEYIMAADAKVDRLELIIKEREYKDES